MLLSDFDIEQAVIEYQMIEPFAYAVQNGGIISYGLTSAGYDLRLGHKISVYKNTYNEPIDPKRFKDSTYVSRILDTLALDTDQPVYVPPHAYILAYSLERLRIPRHLKGRCVGKSTYARCGLVVNTTPAEPGWEGHLTIEIANTTPAPVRIYPGEGICQMEFELLTNPPQVDYAAKCGKYMFQGPEPVPARVKE